MAGVQAFFTTVPDPRAANARHRLDEILLVAEAIHHRARRLAEKLAQSPDDHVARSVWIASIAQLETARHKLLEGSFGPGAGEGSPALPA